MGSGDPPSPPTTTRLRRCSNSIFNRLPRGRGIPAGKLKGNAELSIMLVSIKSGDQVLQIETDNVTTESSSKGKGSAIKIGGGTAVGGVLGGILGGRKGAAI